MMEAPVVPDQNIKRKISEMQTKKYSLTTELKRMKDSKRIMDMGKDARPSSGSAGSDSESKEGGFKFYHILIMMVIGMALGAYVSMNFLNVAPPVAQVVPPIPTADPTP